MLVIHAADVQNVLTFPLLIEAIRKTFARPAGTPRRTVYQLEENDPFHDAFAVLPAWSADVIGVKAFTYLPSNGPKGKQILHSKILLFDRSSGAPLALVDGTTVTYWRTAAVSALASDYLSRKDSKRLLLCGTGNLGVYLVEAHTAVRQYDDIAIWGRNAERAEQLVAKLKEKNPSLPVRAVTTVEGTAREADVIVCATASTEPLIEGAWVKPGAHTDFLGNHHRQYRECDTALVVKARVFVDSLANTMNEAGEILVPIEEGQITADHVVGELANLCSGSVNGREAAEEITLFKSVGTALSDLAAAHLVTQRVQQGGQ